jgi:hypothetical protein
MCIILSPPMRASAALVAGGGLPFAVLLAVHPGEA